MKWQAGVLGVILGAVAPVPRVAAADTFGVLVQQIHKAGMAPAQSVYSHQLRKSVNAASIQRLEQACAQQHPDDRVQTFSVLGIMRLDGVLRAPVALPDNAFTRCVSAGMSSVNFPLPPGNQRGWPVAMQLDGSTGRVLYMAGDRQQAMPLYQRTMATSMPWTYTPVPQVPAHLRRSCKDSVWVSVDAQGRVKRVDPADSTCPAAVDKDVDAAARQWIYMGAGGGASGDSIDVRLTFRIGFMGVQVSL